MAEILLKIIDHSPDPMSFKAGDVVYIRDDGFSWGSAEREDPSYRIIKAPLTQTDIDFLLKMQTSKLIANKNTAKRANKIDTTSIKAIDDSVKVAKNTGSIITFTKRTDLTSAIITK